MKQIRIERKGGVWVAQHRASDYPDVCALFGLTPDMNGEVGIPTPYRETVHAKDVLWNLRDRNPDAFVYFRETFIY